MEIFDNPPVFPSIRSEESSHPVLQQLKDRIAELETQLATNKATTDALDTERVETIRKVRSDKWAFEERVKTVLSEAWDDHDQETIKHIADNLDISLTKTKQIEVNVTFTIDIELEMDEEIDPEWDFDFSVNHHAVQDYTSDVIYSKDIS